MKITLYMAISIDGFIATNSGDSDWISENDIEIFDTITQDADCVIIGNNTYHQYKGEIYPIKNTDNIVISTKNQKDEERISFMQSPEKAIKVVKEKGHKNTLLVGGGHINSSFLRKNLIDEIIIDIQPIILGEGIKIFEEFTKQIQLEFIEHKTVPGGLNILKYKVKK